MPSTDAPRIALVPEQAPAWMADAISAGGGHLVAPAAAEGLVWGSPADADGLAGVGHQGVLDFAVRGVVRVAHLLFRRVDIFTESIGASRNILAEIYQVFVSQM